MRDGYSLVDDLRRRSPTEVARLQRGLRCVRRAIAYTHGCLPPWDGGAWPVQWRGQHSDARLKGELKAAVMRGALGAGARALARPRQRDGGGRAVQPHGERRAGRRRLRDSGGAGGGAEVQLVC